MSFLPNNVSSSSELEPSSEPGIAVLVAGSLRLLGCGPSEARRRGDKILFEAEGLIGPGNADTTASIVVLVGGSTVWPG